jgi:hypothetical protein
MRHPLRTGALLLLPLLVGCTTWMGRNESEDQTKRVTVESNNFKIVKTNLQSEATCPYIFPFLAPGLLGMGGIALGDTALYANAYDDLRASAQLKGAQQLYNVVEEIYVKPHFLVYGEITLKLTADVIEFTGEYKDYEAR